MGNTTGATDATFVRGAAAGSGSTSSGSSDGLCQPAAGDGSRTRLLADRLQPCDGGRRFRQFGQLVDEHVPDNVFTVGSISPRSRRQDLKTLRDTMVKWALDKPVWLTS